MPRDLDGMDDAYLGHERSGNALVKTGTVLCLGHISRSDLLSSSFVEFFSAGIGQWSPVVWIWAAGMDENYPLGMDTLVNARVKA